MTAAEQYAAALAAIEVRRALVEAGTPGPWEHVCVPFRDTASHSVKVKEHVLALVGWETEEPVRAPADAQLIVAAVNAFAADTDALESVLERHAPGRTTIYGSRFCERGCGYWPCPDAVAVLTALGVSELTTPLATEAGS